MTATRVFIAGGTGFVGRALARCWLERGAKVIVSSRHPSVARGPIELVRWDPATDPAPSAIADCRFVYNLVGENIGASRWSESKKRALRESRIVSTSKLVASLSPSAEAFLCASAVSAYAGDGSPCPERSDLPASPRPSFIHAMTRDWETSALDAPGNARRVLLRIGVVIGDEGMLEGVLPLFRARMARHLGSPEVEFPWIDPRDAARLLVFLAEHPQASGAFNVVAPGRTTFAEFSEIVQRELGIRSWFGLPAWVVRLFLGADASQLVLARYDARPERALALGFRFEHAALGDSIRVALSAKRIPKSRESA